MAAYHERRARISRPAFLHTISETGQTKTRAIDKGCVGPQASQTHRDVPRHQDKCARTSHDIWELMREPGDLGAVTWLAGASGPAGIRPPLTRKTFEIRDEPGV